MKEKLYSRLILIVACIVLFPVACITPRKGPQRAFNNAAKYKPFDAIIVPGVPFENNSWDSVMKARVLWSWILYKNGITRNIIYSGGAVYSPYYESRIMGLYAQQLGVPKEHIYYDTLAEHSTENVYYSYLLAKQVGFKSIALATDPFQSFLLRGFTRKRFATPIYHIPFVTDSLAVYNHLHPTIKPKLAKAKDFTSIREKESFFKRLKGTMGKNIDWSQYDKKRLDSL